MDFDRRRDLVEASVQRRIIERDMSGGDVPRGFLVFNCLLIPVCVFAGVFIADHMYFMDLDAYTDSSNTDRRLNYSIDGYEIRFVSPEMNQDMEGNWGFTYPYRSDDIFIDKELLDDKWYSKIREVCRHEKLHNLGIGEEGHDMIDIYEGQITDPTCTKLLSSIRQ